MKKNLKIFSMLVLGVALASVVGCEDPADPVNPNPPSEIDPLASVKNELRDDYIDIYYYWNDVVRSKNRRLTPSLYPTLENFFDALLYEGDRWSWMCDKEYFVASETGVQSGTWGCQFSQLGSSLTDYYIRVSYIYPDSPLKKYGVSRGAYIAAINGTTLGQIDSQEKLDAFNEGIVQSEASFTFHLADGRDTSFTASMAQELQTSPVLKYCIFDGDDFEGLNEKVGYFHFLSFKSQFMDEIDQVFTYFKSEGVKKIILDLRYNGGGDTKVLEQICSYLAPASSQGQVLNRNVHNTILSDAGWDETNYIPENPNSLDIDGLYVIYGPNSASSSEQITNGLKPYLKSNIHIVGRQSYGKPNGMYVLMYPGSNADYEAYNKGDYTNLQYAYLPIAFYVQNIMGEQVPAAGYEPEQEYVDDLYNDFGVEEENIKGILTHIATGSYPDEQYKIRGTRGASVNGFLISPQEDFSIKEYFTTPPVSMIQRIGQSY